MAGTSSAVWGGKHAAAVSLLSTRHLYPLSIYYRSKEVCWQSMRTQQTEIAWFKTGCWQAVWLGWTPTQASAAASSLVQGESSWSRRIYLLVMGEVGAGGPAGWWHWSCRVNRISIFQVKKSSLDQKFALKKGKVFSGGVKTRAECRMEIKIGSCWV